MRIVTLREIPEDQSLRQSWNELVQAMDPPEIFYTCEWAISVQRAYSSTLHPFLVLFYENDSLVGIAPLAITGSGGEAVFLTATTGDYCDFLSRPGRRREILDGTLAELRKHGVSTLVLANLPADSPTATLLRESARQAGFHSYARDAYLCARVVLGTAGQRAALKADLQKKKVYRRAVRDMTQQGLEILHLRHCEEIKPCLNSFYDAHIARFRETGRVSNIEAPERRHFLDQLALELCRQQWLVLSCMRLRGVPIAWNYGFRFHGSWFWYQPTFDSNYNNFSPGFCLLGKLVEEACDTPDLQVVDLGLGAEGYKERFATTGRQTLHVTLNQSVLAHARTVVRHRAATLVKRSPAIERWIRSVLSAVSR